MAETPLAAVHDALGARFTQFAGWTMPLQFEGVLAEHMAVRRAVGVFDVSHLGRFTVEGPGSIDLIRRQLCNDVATIAPGRAQYTMALNDAGGVEDDIIVWWLDRDRFWVLPNGVNFDEIVRRFAGDAPDGVTVTAVRHETVLLAVQGPEAPGVIEKVLGVVPKRFRTVETGYAGGPCWVAGTGYTGERGAEIAVPLAAGERLYRELIEAGAAPCGLGARDTLRLEMGYPLWGQDLDPGTTPLEAGLGWVVEWEHDFVGRPALEVQRDHGIGKQLVGFVLDDRRVPRHGSPLRVGESAGSVASGNFSPMLERGIGMGYVSPDTDATEVVVEVRGTELTGRRVDPPFIAR
ncbi:MAG: glycine cleavage system aminomethyltransferase GcvT [Acidimicrobiia bacterium]